MDNYNQHIRQKINDLNHKDLPFNESRLWQKLEEKLAKKQTKPILIWWKFATAACVIFSLCLGGYFWKNTIVKNTISNNILNHYLSQKEEQTSLLKTHKEGKQKHEKLNKFSNKSSIKLSNSKPKYSYTNKHILIESKSKYLPLSEIQLSTSSNKIEQIDLPIQAILPSPTHTTDDKSNSIKVAVKKQKLRVIHISEYMGEQPEISIKPIPKFTISFAKSAGNQILE